MITRRLESNPFSLATAVASLILSVIGPGCRVAYVDAATRVSDPSRPHVLHTEIADVILRVRGGAVCSAFPTDGSLTLAGFQPLDSDGTLLRGTRYDSPMRPKGSTGPFARIDTAAGGCELPVSDAAISGRQVKLPCGLIPGSSGGGVFAERSGRHILVGVISTIATDLSYNGIVPLASVHELLDNPLPYTYQLGADATRPNTTLFIRS